MAFLPVVNVTGFLFLLVSFEVHKLLAVVRLLLLFEDPQPEQASSSEHHNSQILFEAIVVRVLCVTLYSLRCWFL